MTAIEEFLLKYLNIRTAYPVAYIDIIVLSTGFIIGFAVVKTILNSQERRIKFLEKILEKEIG